MSPAIITCWHCKATTNLQPELFDQYFAGRRLTCDRCNAALDFWRAVKAAVHENFLANTVFNVLGASSTWFRLTLNPGVPTIFKYRDFGIPQSARILYVNYTPNAGGLFPAIAHGNIPTRRDQSDEVVLWPHRISGNIAQGQTELSVLVTWTDVQDDDIVQVNLFSAAEAYSNSEFNSMVIPANVAAEAELSRFVTRCLEPFVATAKVERFLNAASYFHQLNVLLPFFVGSKSLPELNPEISSTLTTLNKLRNQLAHTGKTEHKIDKAQAASLLAASLMAVRYLRFVTPRP